MAIKMRVLYNSGKKGMAQFANAVKEKYDLPVNAVSGKFPPEYPCDKERIVILAISAKSEMPDDLRRFCGGLNKTQAQNVALLVDGKQADADKIAEAIRAYSMTITKRAMLSRGASAIRGQSLIVNLPGSPKAVEESLTYILDSLEHGMDILLGRDGECARR